MLSSMHIRDLERRENAAQDLTRAREELTRLEHAVSAAQERLKHACFVMVLDHGMPVVSTALAAGVHRQTLDRWLMQEKHLRAMAGQMNADPFR